MFFNQESKAAAKELKAKTKVADNDDDLAEIFYYVEEGGKKPNMKGIDRTRAPT